MNDTPTDSSHLPLPAKRLTFRRSFLALTGGEQGCPRKRFFMSIALAALVMELVGRVLGTAQFSAYQQLEDSPVFWLLPVLTVLTSLAMLFGIASAGLFTHIYAHLCHYFGFTFSLPYMARDPQSGLRLVGADLPSMCYPICCILLILASLTAFSLAWRRLRDAGYSPWLLLAGLWTWFFDGVVYVGCLNDAFYWCSFLPGWTLMLFVLKNLGGLWLLYLFCKPAREQTPGISQA